MVKVKGYKQFGGKHAETAAIKNVINHHGLNLSEDLVFGLSGGVSFVYWQMKCMPSPIQAMKYANSRETAVAALARRIGCKAVVKESGSDNRAKKLLIDIVEEGRPAICWGDASFLPHLASPGEWRSAPSVFVVHEVGIDEGQVSIADRGKYPINISMEQLVKARGSKLRPYPPKNRIVDLILPESIDNEVLIDGIYDSVAVSHDIMVNPPIKNLGLKGIKKWADLAAKWPKLFPGKSLFGCLHQIMVFAETSGTGGGGFRKMYAGFMKEAAKITGVEQFKEVSKKFMKSAKSFEDIVAAALPDEWLALKKHRELEFKRQALIENNTNDAINKLPKLIKAQDAAIDRAERELEKRDPSGLIDNLQAAILKTLEKETQAFNALGEIIEARVK